MPDREKVIRGLEICSELGSWHGRDCRFNDAYKDCPYRGCETGCVVTIAKDAITLLKEQEAKSPVHIHEEYPEHDWERKENGDIDDLAFDVDFHNGPMCKRCYYSFCIHCDPDGWNKKPCIIDEYKCPKCGRHISKGTKFCSDCGQVVKWDA